jgi:hypothetical protein
MKKQVLIILSCLVALFGKAQNDTVLFSVKGGFYENVFPLELHNANPQNHIRYTVNGNRPTAQSSLYEEALVLDEQLYSESDIYTIQISPDDLVYVPDSIQHCIVIRAAVFDENDSCVSQVMTNSYFIRALGCDTHGLPAISICADSLDLFGYERGIMVPGILFDTLDPEHTGNYYMHGSEWERQINVEFCEVKDNSGINQTCGMRTHGNRARRQPQKGLKIYAREEYGKKRFKHQFFENSMHNSFKHLVIKPYSTLYPYSSIQDYICSQAAIDLGLESGLSRPVVLYLNGEYWGIYFLQEKMDERYLEDHLHIDIENCMIVGDWYGLAEHGGSVDAGGNNMEFVEMMNWLETADLSKEENYLNLCTLVDIDDYMDYIIFETFVANNDWPANNMRCWKMNGGRWRWMFFDGDAAFNNYSLDPFANPIPLDVFGNATYSGDYSWPSSKQATLMFRKCLENEEFVRRFENRMLELCHDVLTYDRLSLHYRWVREQMYSEIEAQSFRFGNPSHFGFWNWACTLTDDFLSTRKETYWAEWSNFVGLNEQGMVSLACYPNPSNEEIHVFFESEVSGPCEITMYDMMGRNVFMQTCSLDYGYNDLVIQSDLTAGVYVLRLGGHSQRIVRF